MTPHATGFRTGQRIQIRIAVDSDHDWLAGTILRAWPDHDRCSVRTDDGREWYEVNVGSLRELEMTG